jgi:hypothetical protein
MKTFGLGLCLTLAATVSVAAPTGGRQQNTVFAGAGIMGIVGPGTTKGVASAGKNMTEGDAVLIKILGDGLLRQPRGAYKLGLLKFNWAVRDKADRLMNMVMWIDGDYAPNTALKGVNEAAANVEFCRVIGVTFMADVEFKVSELKQVFDRTVNLAYPHHTQTMRDNHAWAEVNWNLCKRKGSDSWAAIRAGNGVGGKQEWVYLGDYIPEESTSSRIEWADIPDHRRDSDAMKNLMLDIFPPVNKYDAAFQPTPGDDGMMDVDPATRGNQ